ncbi:hypothetical protein [Thiohalorhabdus sp.]|uniref:hypothetical protein n=1 Tax=Thiohalorhabdus sp. TaxID=3094134 RepID=UPI002FC395BC
MCASFPPSASPPPGPNAAESDSSASNPNPNALWAAQSHGVVKLRAADGSLLLELAEAPVRAVATDPRCGTLWTYGRALKSFTPEGDQRTTTDLTEEEDRAAEEERGRGHGSRPEEEGDRGRSVGHDREGPGQGVPMAVSPGDGGVWVVLDETLVRVARNGAVQWRLELDEEAEGVAADTYRNRLWVAQEERLVAFAADGSRAAGIDLEDRADLKAEALAYAPDLEAQWVAGEERLLRLAPDGTVAYRSELEAGERLAADGQGGLWLAGEPTLRHLATNGPVRLELRPFPRHGGHPRLGCQPHRRLGVGGVRPGPCAGGALRGSDPPQRLRGCRPAGPGVGPGPVQ